MNNPNPIIPDRHNPNPVIPWCAKTYFADPSKWELIKFDDRIAKTAPALTLEGTLLFPEEWKGMREKYTPRKVWLVVYNNGGVTAHHNKRRAEAVILQDLSSSHIQEVELIPPSPEAKS